MFPSLLRCHTNVYESKIVCLPYSEYSCSENRRTGLISIIVLEGIGFDANRLRPASGVSQMRKSYTFRCGVQGAGHGIKRKWTFFAHERFPRVEVGTQSLYHLMVPNLYSTNLQFVRWDEHELPPVRDISTLCYLRYACGPYEVVFRKYGPCGRSFSSNSFAEFLA